MVTIVLPHLTEIKFTWNGRIHLRNLFFSSSNSSDISRAKELQTLNVPGLEFDFYTEEGKEKIMIKYDNRTDIIIS